MLEIEKDPIQNQISEKLNSLGIKAVLFDFDDTLIFTSEIFLKFMTEYVEKVGKETGIDPKIIDESLRRLNDEAYKTSGVNPARWSHTVEKMAKEFVGNEDSVINNLDILMNIYLEEPRFHTGAKTVLEVLKATGIKIGLVTHANVDWTYRKLNSTGFIDYFDSILIANENEHKSAKHWESIMLDLEVTPSECLVIGDSLSGDIIPTAKIGARTVWLHKGSTWSVYRTGEVPKSTVPIDDISELLSTIADLR